MQEQKLRIGSLFSGIGGIELGLERTGGFKTVWQVENNEYAQKVLAMHWPDAARWDDVKTFPPPEGDWEVDIITAGFPCQDIYSAGRRAGIEGERSGLFFEAIRIFDILSPRWILLENVSRLLVRDMGVVLQELAKIGYDSEWHSIPAASVGAHHRRDRVFIISNTQHDGSHRQGSDERERQCEEMGWIELTGRDGSNRDVADSISSRLSRSRSSGSGSYPTSIAKGETVESIYGRFNEFWSVEPRVGRVANGIPNSVDRLKALGNAVVPQVAQFIGEKILERHNESRGEQ